MQEGAIFAQMQHIGSMRSGDTVRPKLLCNFLLPLVGNNSRPALKVIRVWSAASDIIKNYEFHFVKFLIFHEVNTKGTSNDE